MENDLSVIGGRIASRRVSLNMTQEYLAEKSELSRVQIANIEKATSKKCGIYTILKIAKALDVTPDYLLLGSFNTLEEDYLDQIKDSMLRCDSNKRKHIIKYINWIAEQDDL